MSTTDTLNALRQAIQASPLTARQVAERAGIRPQHLSGILHGTREASPAMLERIAGALHSDPGADARRVLESLTRAGARYQRAVMRALGLEGR